MLEIQVMKMKKWKVIKKRYTKKIRWNETGEFNKWFNKMFEKVKVTDSDTDSGYGKWFKSDEDVNE